MKKTIVLVSMLCMTFCLMSCEGNKDTRPVMMLRLRPTNTDTDQSWNETFSIIKANLGKFLVECRIPLMSVWKFSIFFAPFLTCVKN